MLSTQPTATRRKHPTLEGLRHSLGWIEGRIAQQRFDLEDREQLVTWLRELMCRVRDGGVDDAG